MTDHSCPDRCHKCPELGGDVLPVCWGTASRGACTCSSVDDNVIQLADRLPPDADDLLTCDCGEQWWELVDVERSPAAVAMDHDGAVVAWGGLPSCVSCGNSGGPGQ